MKNDFNMQLSESEKQSIYYLSGCIARKIFNKYKACKICTDILLVNENNLNCAFQMFTKLKIFKSCVTGYRDAKLCF